MTEKEALNRLAALCSQAERCPYELTEKMHKWELTAEEQARVLERLTAERFVDERRYVRCFAMDKIRYNKWGRRKVEQALRAKRIDRSVMQEVLDAMDSSEYLSVLRPLLKSKEKSLKAASDCERRARLTRYALGRGFSLSEIRQCTDTPDDITGDEDFMD